MNSFVSADAFEAAVEASPAHKATLNHRRRKVAEYRLQQHNGHNGAGWGTAETVSCVPVVAVPCMGWLIVFLLTQCLLLKWRKRKGFYPKASRYAARCYKVYIRRKCALDRKVIRLYIQYIVLRYILDIKVLRAKERCKKKLQSIFNRCKLICVNATVSIYRHIPPMRVSAAVIFLGLLMSGNVELNPGPKQEKLLKLCKDGCTAEVGVFKSLLDQGVDPNIKDEDGLHPLWYASRYGKRDLVELFLQYKADANFKAKDGYTALRAASFDGHTNVVRLLITRGATVDIKDKDGATPLYVASQNGHKGVVELLLEKANINQQRKDGATPLYVASQNGHKGVVELLLEKGANINYQDEDGFSPLSVASQNGHKGVVELLLEKANINQQDKDGATPLYVASQNGHKGVVELLLEKGAIVNQQRKDGFSPLYVASQNGHKGVVELLLEKANINQQDKDGYAALRIASLNGHKNVVHLLITRGATVDIKGNDGRTALHRASSNGHTDVVKLLVDSGAQIDIKDKDGQTALDLASSSGHTGVVKLLVDSVAPIGNKSHLLLKHELEALEKVLAAYSDDKLKDIRLNLQKKKGGEISLEEVETSLRENGLSSIADDLKENLEKCVEDQKHYEAYKSALKDGLVLNMHYLKFLFFGPPRTGKSTARRRLLKEIVNLSTFDEPSASTKLAEQTEVMICIKKSSSETVTISGSNWSSIKKLNVQSDEDISYLIQLFCKLISKYARKPQKTNTAVSKPIESDSGPITNVNQNQSQESVGAEVIDIVEDRTNVPPKEHTNLQTIPEKPEELPIQLSDAEEIKIDEALMKFATIVKSESPDELCKFLEDLTMVNMVDVGGQPAFLELCPAFTTGPALYFVFFRLDKDFKAKNEVKFQSADGKEVILNSSYCTQTVIHQALSSIACFGSHETAEIESKTLAFSNVSGRALLFGTYKDEADEIDISEMNKTLRERFENTELCQKSLLLKASDKELFYSLNNKTGDESEMSPIRKDIEKIIKGYFPPLPIPASWLMFRVILNLLEKPIVTLAECGKIADHVQMATPVREAIWFFHHNIGSLMHYPDIPSMENVVICDSQVVFDTTSELIIDTYKIENRDSKIPQGAVDDFHKNGQFSLAHINHRTEAGRHNNRLSLKQLVDLLKHHNIIAEISAKQLESNQEQISPQFAADHESSAQAKPDPTKCHPIFMMPAVLQDASEEELELSSKQEAAPLMIQFLSGFVPFGVFCASIASLIARQDNFSPKWELHGQPMKNKVTFCIEHTFHATLISRPQILEIRVERDSKARNKRSLPNVCSTVRQTVHETLKAVINKMKYKAFAKSLAPVCPTEKLFEFAFTCCKEEESHSDHFMKVNRDDDGYFAVCTKDSVAIIIEEKHLTWFNQTEHDIGEKSQLSNTGVKRGNERANQSDGKTRKIVKSGQITHPDRLFNDLSKDIGKSYSNIGYELDLTFDVMENELETGRYENKTADIKAMKMLQLWKKSTAEEEFTYAVLAAALEKYGLKRCADQHCYTTDVSK